MTYKDMFVPYDSPIDVVFNRAVDNIMAAFNNSIDDGVVECVVKAGFNVDKDKLVEALTQDRKRYEEAYRKGYAQRDADIVRCGNCKFGEPYYEKIECNHPRHNIWYCQNADWYCADGERKDGDGDG